MNSHHCQTKRATLRRALSGPIAVSALLVQLAYPLAAAPNEIDADVDHLIMNATCAEIVPIISGPMREPLLQREFADTLTSILPVFIYGYALAREQSFDEARFELIENCQDNPDKPFAGFPPYRPDPAYWPEAFIKLWEEAQTK